MKKEWKIIAVLWGLILASRAVLYRFMPYFDPFTLLHHLDPVWLETNLWESVYYLHMQPPLFNLILGVLLKLAPAGTESTIFTAFFLLIALGIAATTYALMRRFSFSTKWAFVMTLLFMLAPQERWMVYNIYLVTWILIGSALLFSRFITSRKIVHLLLFLGLMASVVWMRSFFHWIVWLGPLFLFTLWMVWSDKKLKKRGIKIAAITLLFFILAGLPYIKNRIEFGFLGGSSWLGMNIAHMTRYIDDEIIQDHLNAGEITEIINIQRFSDVSVYQDYYDDTSTTGIAALDAPEKSNAVVNANHAIYLRTSDEYKQNTITLLKAHPTAYVKAVFNQMYIFMGFIPYKYFDTYPDWHINQITPSPTLNKFIGTIDTFVIPPLFFFGFCLSIIALALHFLRNMKRRKITDAALSGFMLWNIVYVFGIANAIELGEANFFRVTIDIFLLVGFMLFWKEICYRNRAS